MKKKKEFSKIIVLALGVVGIAVLALSFYLMFITHDISALPDVIEKTATVVGFGISFYFWKAKSENKIKLMKQNGIKPTEETFKEGDMI
jgi:hypothetical protein